MGVFDPEREEVEPPFHEDDTAVNHTGTTSETTLRTITIPANRLGREGGFTLRALFDPTGTAGDKTLRIYWGGNLIATSTLLAANTAVEEAFVDIRNKGLTAQRVVAKLQKAATVNYVTGSESEDTTQDVDLVITGQLSNAADTLSLIDTKVQLYGQA